jgi:hypothetical protein
MASKKIMKPHKNPIKSIEIICFTGLKKYERREISIETKKYS